MFTGLIQEIGEIVELERSGSQTRLTVRSNAIAAELKTGDSVAVSGVCLTALDIGDGKFSADLAQETLDRTSLGKLKPGALVNLELPARAQDRMGGHVVQGHVDGTGRIVSLEKIKYHDDWRLVLEIPQSLGKYVAAQGSITVEGISLTVAAVNDNGARVEIAIIPHTWEATNLKTRKAGDHVNIEVDVLAKYAEKMVRGRAAGGGLTVADLVRRGF